MTTAIPPFDTPTPTSSSSRSARWWMALAAGVVALSGAAGAAVAFDGAETEPPVAPLVERVGRGTAEMAPAPAGPVSADAAERRAIAAARRCVGMSADAAERCVTGG